MGFEKGQGKYQRAERSGRGRGEFRQKERKPKGKEWERGGEEDPRKRRMEARAKVHERSGGGVVRSGECRAFLLVPALALLETREADQPDRRTVESDLICAYIFSSPTTKIKKDF
ncbi:unnamed protein product [Lasius platythorax]|uniref:Uncharacterized protein n=1 Tax=Lasius platythorax TaxID=488582 RepID=A0AAV2ND63_9HYME